MRPITPQSSTTFNRPGGAAVRLGYMRTRADAWRIAHPTTAPDATWRTIRAEWDSPAHIEDHPATASDDGREVYVPTAKLAGLRVGRYADEVITLRHTGWYADAHCGETYRGRVWQLPGRNGAPCYIAGFQTDGTGYVTLSARNGRPELFTGADAEREAAIAADETARIAAEREREYSEQCDRARELSDANDADIETIRACRALSARYALVLPALSPEPSAAVQRETMRAQMAALRRDVRAAAERIRERREELATLPEV